MKALYQMNNFFLKTLVKETITNKIEWYTTETDFLSHSVFNSHFVYRAYCSAICLKANTIRLGFFEFKIPLYLDGEGRFPDEYNSKVFALVGGIWQEVADFETQPRNVNLLRKLSQHIAENNDGIRYLTSMCK